MSKFAHNVMLHVSGCHIPPKIYLVNSDSGRQINFHIAEMDIAGYSAKIWVEKPSGLPIYNDCTINEQVVIAEITDQMIAENGKSKGQIELTSEEDGRVTSFEFILVVQEKVGGDGVESTHESTALERMMLDYAANAGLAVIDDTLTKPDAAADAAVVGERFAEVEMEVDDLTDDVNLTKAMLGTKFDDVKVEDGYLYLLVDGEVVKGPYGPFAGGSGGGSGSSNNAELSLTNTTGWIYKTVSLGSSCPISVNWTSLENGISTGAGSLKITVNNVVKSTQSVEQGDLTLELKDYLGTGNNTVKVNITDIYGNSRTIFFNIDTVVLGLESSFDASVPYTGEIIYPYTPTGAVEKTVHFVLDGAEIGTAVVKTSGRQQSFTIPAQSHGSHTWDVYFEALIDADIVRSEPLHYDLICTESGDNTVIISCPFTETEVEQLSTVQIPWIAYDPSNLTTQVAYEENGEQIATLTVDRTLQTWSYRPTVAGTVSLAIVCGDVRKEIELNVKETSIQVEAETEALGLYLSSYGRSNNEDNPGTWSWKDISANFSGFNYVSDGWQLDDDGNTVLRLAGDARVEIPYQIFANDFRTTGKTIEFELATRNVLNYDAALLSCMSGDRGIEITTQMAAFASEQSAISTKYKEEEHVRISFVVEKRSGNKMLICYINGKISRLCLYSDDDDFSQLLPVNITIGSNDCTTDIYNIRVYDNDLTRYQMLDNWIADTQDIVLRKARYERNNIYDAYGRITIDTLKKDVPYLVLECPVLPTFKGDKKTCSGYYVDPVHPERSFRFEDAIIDVQGTSSRYYWIKNVKAKFKNGFILEDGTIIVNYQLKGEGVPTNTFTFKADVASSEGWLNVVLADLYNELCPTKTPAQEADPRVRQTIDGQPIVIFHDSGDGPVFYGKFNFNHDKGTPEVFGFEEGDESWEILQNGTDRVAFKNADFSGDDWKNDFEARYPEGNTDTTRLQAFAAWIESTDTDAATNEALPAAVTYNGVEYTADTAEYRLAKFIAELADWADVKNCIFYYLFTLLFCCIDQREKNAFPTFIIALMLWIWLFYDADSSCGTDNKGNLAFDYWLEDIDFTEAGEPVFNGQNSVFWNNIRKGFWNDVVAEYQRLRTELRADGRPLLSYDVVMDKITEHVNTWCEAIYNEDAYKKYIEPYVLNGDATYLPMAFGDKVEFMKYWLYNRFRYFDSMCVTGTSMTNRILIRAHAKAPVTLMSYLNMYGHVYFNSEMVEHRMFRGQEYVFESSASGAEDAVIGINDSDLITSIGDLAPLQVETIDISKAPHLTYLKPGDGADDYVNNNLITITLGNNVRLQFIDSRNCPKLTGAIDASGCTGLAEAYFDGTAITRFKLPNGCNIKKLHLPETVTNISYKNLKNLEEFVIPSYANVATLNLENNSSVIDPLAILREMPANGRVRIIGFDWTFDSEEEVQEIYDILSSMRGLDEYGNNMDLAQMKGIIRVDTISSKLLWFFKQNYPSIEIISNTVILYTVRFYDGDTLLQTSTAGYNESVVYTGETPTGGTDYLEFIGWSPEPVNIQGDTDCYAQYYDTREITDDWATVAAACLDGTAASKYAIGAYKNVDIAYEDGTTETIPLEVVAHNQDELSDGAYKWEKGNLAGLPKNAMVVCCNDELHAINTGIHYKYDGTTWVLLDDTPPAMSKDPVIVVCNNEIHVMGGKATETAVNTTHYKWDGAEWISASTLPACVEKKYCAVVYNDEIHLVCPDAGDAVKKAHWKWNSTEWVRLEDLPISGVLYAFVHNNEMHVLNSTSHYKFDGTEWTEAGSAPFNGYSIYKPVAYRNSIHFINDYNPDNHYQWDGEKWECVSTTPFISAYWYSTYSIFVYNNEINVMPRSGNNHHWKWSGPSWEQLENTTYNLSNATFAMEYNNVLYIAVSNTLYKWDGTEWTIETTCPVNFGAACVYNGEIYNYWYTDDSTNEHYRKVYKYDWTEWTVVCEFPTAGSVPQFVEYEGALHSVGAYHYATMAHYKWDGTEWTKLPDCPVAVNKAFIDNNELHIIGGTNHYKWDGTEWSKVSTLPATPVWYNLQGAICVNDTEIYVRAALTDGSSSDTGYYIKWDGTEWSTVAGNNVASQGQMCCSFRHKVHLFGGWSNDYGHYVLSNPKATLTFLAKNLLSESRPMNSTAMSGSVNYVNTELRTWLNNELLNALPSELQSNITEVKKYRTVMNNWEKSLISFSDRCWLGSDEEFGNNNSYTLEGEGEAYSQFVDDDSRKCCTVNGEYRKYWTSSTYTGNNDRAVTIGIDGANITEESEVTVPQGVRFGLCLK